MNTFDDHDDDKQMQNTKFFRGVSSSTAYFPEMKKSPDDVLSSRLFSFRADR